jgi:hypothetical protein
MKYQVKWDDGFYQICKSRSETLELVNELLKNGKSNITISKL